MATETTVADGSLGEGAGADQAVGMPQLDFATFPNQIFWLLVALVATYLILTRVALPRISAVLAERQGTITNDIAAAEDLKSQAADAEDAYNKALADARAEAQTIVAQTRAEIQEDLDAAAAKADAEISARTAESEKRIGEIRAGAMENVREVARDTALAVIAKIGAEADEASVNAAVDARVKG